MKDIVKRLKKFGFQIDKKRKFINGYRFHFKKSFERIDNSKYMYYLTLTDDVNEEIILIYHEYDGILVMVNREVLEICMDICYNRSYVYSFLKPSSLERCFSIPKSKIQFFLV